MRLEEALEQVRAAACRLPSEQVPAAEALGRHLAESVYSDLDLPPFDRSMLDGFACRRADLPGPMPQAGYVVAGESPGNPLPPGACARVMTGAPVPAEADFVFGIEQAQESPEGVRFTGTPSSHGNIARRAEDVKTGDELLQPGTRLYPQHLAVLATVGRGTIAVARRPSVGVIATGSELVPLSQQPTGPQIRNSNSIQLSALARLCGAEVIDHGIIPDERDAQREALRAALQRHDLVLTSGGVSVGDRDFVPELLAELGLDIRLRKVDIQPGKPIVFGTRGDCAAFALAGNPLSSYVQFMLLVRPFLAALQGGEENPPRLRAPLAEPLERGNAARALYRPVSLDESGRARPVRYHGSGHLTSYANADALAVMPEGVARMEAGEAAELLLLR
ncbi:MAG: hypothetical protein RLZZ303_3183 [Candidatus Hydrogenedentota bacterium]|jgi:molybdopterin molybdotransferase